MATNEQVEVSSAIKDSRREDVHAPSGETAGRAYGYCETPAPAVVDAPKTALEELRANINVLEDLQGRLRFLMGEIRQHIVRS